MKKIHLMIVLIFTTFILFACGKQEGVENKFEREDVTLSYTVTSGALTNEQQTGWTGGTRQEVTTTFKTNPGVVAIFSYDILDILDTVGIEKTSIVHLGVPKSNLPTYLNAYTSNEFRNVGTLFIPNWDELDLFMPDLIIIGGRSAGAYDQLKKDYPYADILDVTLVESEYLEGMKRNAKNISKIFPSIKDQIDERLLTIEASMNAIKEVSKDFEALFVMVNGESLSFYGQTGRFASLYDEFGFQPADDKVDQGGSHGSVIGYEYVAQVDPHILFLLDRGVATGGSSTIDAVKNNQLVKKYKCRE